MPILLYRIAAEVMPDPWPEFLRPHRVGRESLLRPHGVENAVNASLAQFGDVSGILVIVDSDDDCPATLGPKLLERIQVARPGLLAAVVLAHREFEAWFLAAAASLKDVRVSLRILRHRRSPRRSVDARNG
ncbi:hypothetical protein [Nonomuraea cypriaca]|uniref:hypothetical protein n=1 Tax=Nonomuraea cypriaca TaxID=1187855 RepID=UPI001A9C76DE|nr:hypothetical protein [Nonomuraea cypriaca]